MYLFPGLSGGGE
jgi:hypothetical protein